MWQIESGITWGQEHFGNGCYMLPVGNWNSKTGLKLTEPLFLHLAHGFRGMTLPIATFNVSIQINNQVLCRNIGKNFRKSKNNISQILHNPHVTRSHHRSL